MGPIFVLISFTTFWWICASKRTRVILFVIITLCIPFTCFPFRYKYINIIFFCCHWLAMSNSCYNPIIYGTCSVSKLSKTMTIRNYLFSKKLRIRINWFNRHTFTGKFSKGICNTSTLLTIYPTKSRLWKDSTTLMH